MKIIISGKQKKNEEVRSDRFTWEAGDVVWEKKPSDKEEEKEDEDTAAKKGKQ